MNITQVQYIVENNQNVCIQALIDDVKVFVPLEKGNRHYDEILKWLAEGNTPLPAE